jgi:D-glycero-D-manno-heptose 1,7-bisphosphate phosphatase
MTIGWEDNTLPWLRADLVWARPLAPAAPMPRPALFLDRDGVVIEERNYLAEPDGVILVEGAAAAIVRARERGRAIVLVSNQSGIGRGLFTWYEHKLVEDRMLDLLAEQGASLDLSLACAHHPGGLPPYDHDHPWRKPSLGMLREAQCIINLDLERSIMVGDKASDIKAARVAGLPSAILVATGYGKNEFAAAAALATLSFRVAFHASIDDVARCCSGRATTKGRHRRL